MPGTSHKIPDTICPWMSAEEARVTLACLAAMSGKLGARDQRHAAGALASIRVALAGEDVKFSQGKAAASAAKE